MNEFTLINKYLKPLSIKNLGALRLSDDIYFDAEKGIAISVDTYVEGVHFIDSSNPDKFLKKILRASLSDLYCKGIKPHSYFLSFALDNKLTKPFWLRKIKKILMSEQKKFNISLAGGDTTSSSKLVVTIVVLGNSKNKPVFRPFVLLQSCSRPAQSIPGTILHRTCMCKTILRSYSSKSYDILGGNEKITLLSNYTVTGSSPLPPPRML